MCTTAAQLVFKIINVTFFFKKDFKKVKKGFIYFMYMSTLCSQKMALDPITDGCEPPCGCWEVNSGPLDEQSVLLSSEPSLQP